MKGIVLTGDDEACLVPFTKGISKPLLPIYNKPLIYYPLNLLFEAGVRQVRFLCTQQQQPLLQQLLGDGSRWGACFEYLSTERGIAEPLLSSAEFIGQDRVCLIQGDQLFYGPHLNPLIQQPSTQQEGATLFGYQVGYQVKEPQRYEVLTFDRAGRVCSIEQQAAHPSSQIALTGLCLYDSNLVEAVQEISRFKGAQLQMSDICRHYLACGKAQVHLLSRGYTWFEIESFDLLLQAAHSVQLLEQRQASLIACLEESALEQGWVNLSQALNLCSLYGKNDYGQLLMKMIQERYRRDPILASQELSHAST